MTMPMRVAETSGRTVDEAIARALNQLGLRQDQVDVDVITEGKAGFLGFGSEEAIVRVTAREGAIAQGNRGRGGQGRGRGGPGGGGQRGGRTGDARVREQPEVPRGGPIDRDERIPQYDEDDQPPMRAAGEADLRGERVGAMDEAPRQSQGDGEGPEGEGDARRRRGRRGGRGRSGGGNGGGERAEAMPAASGGGERERDDRGPGSEMAGGRRDGRGDGRGGRNGDRDRGPRMERPSGPIHAVAPDEEIRIPGAPDDAPNGPADEYADEMDRAGSSLRDILNLLGLANTEISAREPESAGDGSGLVAQVLDIYGEDEDTSDELGLLIGRRGETLSSLQYLINTIVAHHSEDSPPVYGLDIEGYRRRREQTLVDLAREVAQEVRDTGDVITLEPMPAAERRIVHLALESEEGVRTESVGSGDQRQVEVLPAE